MKLTKSKLKQIIQEELQAILYEASPEMCYSVAQRKQLTALAKKYPNRDTDPKQTSAYSSAHKKIIPEQPCSPTTSSPKKSWTRA